MKKRVRNAVSQPMRDRVGKKKDGLAYANQKPKPTKNQKKKKKKKNRLIE